MIDWLRRPFSAASAPAPAPAPTKVMRTLSLGGRELPLAIRRLQSARRITLRLAPDGSEARVTLPPWGRVAEAEAFARDRSDWLADQLAARGPAKPPRPGSTIRWRGEDLTIAWRADAPRRPVLSGATVILGGPEESLATRVQRWLESEAMRLCQADCTEYCARAGIAAAPLRLSRALRRWGSCAADGTIRINWRLVMAPDAVRRSVVAHEVAHLVHFDHGPRFHRLLAAIYDGDLHAANRWLKREGRTLYAAFG